MTFDDMHKNNNHQRTGLTEGSIVRIPISEVNFIEEPNKFWEKRTGKRKEKRD